MPEHQPVTVGGVYQHPLIQVPPVRLHDPGSTVPMNKATFLAQPESSCPIPHPTPIEQI